MEIIDAIERARDLRFEERLDEALEVLLECAAQHEDEGLSAEIAGVYTERGRRREDLHRALHDFGEARSWCAMPATVAAEAMAHYRAGDGAKAKDLAKMAVMADPDEIEAHLVLARLHIDAGEFDAVGKMMAGFPADVGGEVCIHLAEGLRGRGRVDEAIQVLSGLRRVRSGDPEVYAGLARCHEARGEYAEAMAAWRQATELAPARAEAWRGFAVAAARASEEIDMVRAVDRAVQLDREGTLAWLERARPDAPMLERYVV